MPALQVQMSYTISLRIYQTNTNAFFRVAEKAVWREAGGGSWGKAHGEHVLAVNSGGGGALRLVSDDTGESFVVALGVHENRRWCDLATGLLPEAMAGGILNEYYADGAPRGFMRKAQHESHSVSSVGSQPRRFTVTYSIAQGANLRANLVIG